MRNWHEAPWDLTTAPEGRSRADPCGAVRPAADVCDTGVLPTGFGNSCSAGWSLTTHFMADNGAEVAGRDRRVCAAVRHLEERAGECVEANCRPLPRARARSGLSSRAGRWSPYSAEWEGRRRCC
jgi:hypothetical protein